ncbi:extracellular solute-binding protein [Cohnella luojiensis]|uniref:Extracellular solute-binding protein n=1 Tax=Cohnella luojiensis TaxID=652876 RepID=A0A4Y8M2R5_9BACL|nr:extracellular solute-binding protein [Cohnella luojiensis]TFE26295.1 extracellular solute-binding protein [Cohnella luojiensis]
MFHLKKGLTVLSALALTFTVLAGCGNKADNANASSSDASAPASSSSNPASSAPVEISFYFTGSQNVKDMWDTLVPKFEEQNKDVKVKLVYIPSGTGAQPTYDRILAAKKAGKGSGDIDLYEDSLSTVTKGGKDDLWDKLSLDSIPNIGNINSKTMDNVSHLAVPYRASAVVLAYNSEKVTTPPSTLDELYEWIRNNPEKFAYNDPSTGGSGNSFVSTSIYKDLPQDAIYSTDPAIQKDWDSGFATLKDLGKYVYGKGIYPKKNQGTLDLLANGEVDMIPAWSDMVLEQTAKGQLPATTKMKQITPGFNGGPTYLMVPKLSEKKEAVYQFLGYVMSPEAQGIIVEKMHGFPGIELANMPQEIQDSFKGVSEGFRSFNIGDLDKEITKRWQSEVAAQ